jgi:quercetin dioxygenase-like cupin family protein
MVKKVEFSHLDPSRKVPVRPGIERVTLAYNDQNMLCYFYLKKGSKLELHRHEAVQNGFVLKGKVRFFKENGSSFIAGPGDGYVFESNEAHGSDILEDSELIECFSPMRPDYAV